MKYEYKMAKLNNEDLWQKIGIQGKNIFTSNSEEPVSLPFADKLGEDGWEMFQVVGWGSNSAYYFRKRISD